MDDKRSAKDGELRVLHQHVLRGDDVALNALAEELLRSLPPSLRRRFRHAPIDLIVDAVEDAIIDYAARPDRFDPRHGVSLFSFVRCGAFRNLLNSLRADSRRRHREERFVAESATTTPRHEETVRNSFDAKAALDRVLGLVDTVPERQALLLWLRGERATQPLAAALSISHLAPAFQRRAVKRFKDRIVKRVRRIR